MIVIVIEDTQEVATLIQLALRNLQLDVIHLTNGQQALEYLTANRPDLIILDIGLPGMSGWQLLDELDGNSNIEDVPVIVLTAHADIDSRKTGTLYRIESFLTKPVMPNVIRDTVQRLLS